MSNEVAVVKKNFREKLWSGIPAKSDELLYKFTDDEINVIAAVRRKANGFMPFSAGSFVIYVEDVPETSLVPFIALTPQYFTPTDILTDRKKLSTLIAINIATKEVRVILTSDKDQLDSRIYSFEELEIEPVDVSQDGNGETSAEGDARRKAESDARTAAFEAEQAKLVPSTITHDGPTQLYDLEKRDPKTPYGILNDANILIVELEKPENADILAAINAAIVWEDGISAYKIESQIPEEIKPRYDAIAKAIDEKSGHSGASWGMMFFCAVARIHNKLDIYGVYLPKDLVPTN